MLLSDLITVVSELLYKIIKIIQHSYILTLTFIYNFNYKNICFNQFRDLYILIIGFFNFSLLLFIVILTYKFLEY